MSPSDFWGGGGHHRTTHPLLAPGLEGAGVPHRSSWGSTGMTFTSQGSARPGTTPARDFGASACSTVRLEVKAPNLAFAGEASGWFCLLSLFRSLGVVCLFACFSSTQSGIREAKPKPRKPRGSHSLGSKVSDHFPLPQSGLFHFGNVKWCSCCGN